MSPVSKAADAIRPSVVGRNPPPTPAGAKAPRRLLTSSLAPCLITIDFRYYRCSQNNCRYSHLCNHILRKYNCLYHQMQ